MSRIIYVVGVLCTCTATVTAGPPELSGRWSGYWISESNGHTGPLHGKFTQLDAETYRVRFHGRFAKIIPFSYSTKMHIASGNDDVMILTTNRNLGPFLGTFQMSATATPTSFDAAFTSRNDSGRFVLTRRR